jgi:hypothetical protein
MKARKMSIDLAKLLGRSVLLLGLAVGLLCYGEAARAAPIKPPVLTQQSLIVQAGPRPDPQAESQGKERSDDDVSGKGRAADWAARKQAVEKLQKELGLADPDLLLGRGPSPHAILKDPGKPATAPLKLRPLTPDERTNSFRALRGGE